MGEERRVRRRVVAGYALFVVAATMAFVALWFPYDRLQAVLLAELSRQTHARLTVESGGFVFPAGVGWRGLRIHPLDGPPGEVVIDVLGVRVALLPLIWHVIDADVTWEAYGGRARGSWVLRRDANGTRSEVDQIGQGFDLSRLPMMPAGNWRGVIRVDLNGQWTNQAWWTGDGSGSIEVADLQADGLSVGGFPVNGIVFDTVSGQVRLKGGTLTLQRLAARGALGAVSGSGTVLIRMPWTESVVNLALALSPAPGASAKAPWLALAGTGSPIAVQITGRAAKPDITLNGLRLP
ncbi:MAG: type II secretion system protein GspN [Nitrospiria bacterium]